MSRLVLWKVTGIEVQSEATAACRPQPQLTYSCSSLCSSLLPRSLRSNPIVAAFIWHFDSRANKLISKDVERTIANERGEFEMTVKRVRKLEGKRTNHHNRLYTCVMKLTKVSEDVIVISTSPVTNGRMSTARGSVGRSSVSGVYEAEEMSWMKVTKLGEKKTKIAYIVRQNLGLLISNTAAKASITAQLNYVVYLCFYFNNLVPASELSLEGGQIIGQELMMRLKEKGKTKESVVSSVLKTNRGLKDMAEKVRGSKERSDELTA